MRKVKLLNDMMYFRGKSAKKGETLTLSDDDSERLVERGVAEFADGMNDRGRVTNPAMIIDDSDVRPQITALRQEKR